MALRHQLWLALPFSIKRVGSKQNGLNSKMYLMSALGSVAVIQTDSNSMAGFGRLADIQLGRMSALTDTGRTEALKQSDMTGS